MPCDSSHMEARPDEVLLRETHQCFEYALIELRRAVPMGIGKAAKDYYGCGGLPLNEAVAALCGLLRSLSAAKRNKIVYNARSPKSRRLADWWERHCKADKKRATP